ncbi:hypothetical protein PsYK624_014370 [Phanerochaete sordida]|uniref:DUF6533 domain-containing protein n=1 Tax=Phanerochaete sordida TaxID=48140 RepID=A0A9P3FZB3_9APHY|nr:hypothetical protein PsYK624_014370 [Phanerochaete sordida]
MTSLVPSTFSIYEITGLSLSVVVGYEYAITFPQEVETIWRRKKSATTMLLLMIRWVMLLFAMCSFFQPFRYSDLMRCERKNPADHFSPRLGRSRPLHRPQNIDHLGT